MEHFAFNPSKVPPQTQEPPWKIRLRQRCADRVRADRATLLARLRQPAPDLDDPVFQDSPAGPVVPLTTVLPLFRAHILIQRQQLFDSILVSELADIGAEPVDEEDGIAGEFFSDFLHHPPPPPGASLSQAEYSDFMLFLEETFRAGLKQEEEALLAQYETMIQAETSETVDDALSGEAVADAMAGEGFVACPLCQRHPLLRHHTVILCAGRCGMRLDTQQDRSGLGFVRAQLESVLEGHLATGCKQRPRFAIDGGFLLMRCEECGVLEVVL